MNQYMSDSSFTDLDPRELILDPNMQARDPELIKNNKAREAQIKKQEEQDKDILDDLLSIGTLIDPPICGVLDPLKTVFFVLKQSDYFLLCAPRPV